MGVPVSGAETVGGFEDVTVCDPVFDDVVVLETVVVGVWVDEVVIVPVPVRV